MTTPLTTITGSDQERPAGTPTTPGGPAASSKAAVASDRGAGRRAPRRPKTRIAVNLLTEDPNTPSGAHWCWTRVVREMATRLFDDEEMHLIVSPASRPSYEGFGENVRYITYPWSNERRSLRTLSEHLYSPLRLPLSQIDLLSTPIAPVLNPSWSVVVHMKTMHAFTEPASLSPAARAYRKFSYPRSTRVADAVVINSESLRAEIEKYLDVDPQKLKLVYEAVDHDLFQPGDRGTARNRVATHGVSKPFVLFVSSLWPYKNCAGLLRAWALVRDQLGDRQLAVVGGGKDERHMAELRALVGELGIGGDVVFVGGVPQEETVDFYRAADVLVYASFNETFGLPILEAMATGCPVVTSDVSSMPEIAGGAAVLCNPHEPGSIARAMLDVLGDGAPQLREKGLKRAAQFTWSSAAAQTLEVYREVVERRRQKTR